MKAAFFALSKKRKVRGSAGLFKMGEASRSSKKHYGIGLYMAENTAKLHGGKLAISNAVGGGAEVKMVFGIIF